MGFLFSGIRKKVLFAIALLCVSIHAVAQDTIRPVDEAEKRVAEAGAPPPGTTNKIVNGIDAPPGKFPFQVALISANAPVNREFIGLFCGGTLIDKQWILTAAHCVPNTLPTQVDVYIGSNELPDGEPGSGIRRSLERIVSHQAYDRRTKDNDIALLKLTSDVPENVMPVIVAGNELNVRYNFDEADAIVIGWGATSEGGTSISQLQRVWVDVQNKQQCELNYQNVLPGTVVTENMFCAGLQSGGKDSCQGDSGGFIGAPLGSRQYVQLGVVSWGFGCARENLYGVYTKVSNYTDWIKEVKANL